MAVFDHTHSCPVTMSNRAEAGSIFFTPSLCPTKAEQRRQITSLNLLATLRLMDFRRLVVFLVTKGTSLAHGQLGSHQDLPGLFSVKQHSILPPKKLKNKQLK